MCDNLVSVQAQLRNWEDKKTILRQHQRAVATRYARALRYLDAGSTVMPTDFDFGYADLNHVIKEGGDKEGGNNSVNKLLQALKSVRWQQVEHNFGCLTFALSSLFMPLPCTEKTLAGTLV